MKQKHSNRLCSVIVSIIVILLVLIAVSLFWVNSRLCFVDYTPYSYSESGDAIKNPYVGLYSIRGYLLAEDEKLSIYRSQTARSASCSRAKYGSATPTVRIPALFAPRSASTESSNIVHSLSRTPSCRVARW